MFYLHKDLFYYLQFIFVQKQIKFHSFIINFKKFYQSQELTMQLLNSNIKTEQRQNLKIKYKNQRLQQSKEIYLCQCQKVYLSFPALYLHVKNKHKIKLTTKINDKICKMQQKDGKTYITYFLIDQSDFEEKKQNQFQSQEAKKSTKNDGFRNFHQEDCERQSYMSGVFNIPELMPLQFQTSKNSDINLKIVVQGFLRQLSLNNYLCYQIASIILGLFIKYIQNCGAISKQFEQIKKSNPQKLIACLPLYMNEFVCYFLPMKLNSNRDGSIEYSTQVQIMKMFGKWLRDKNLTNLILIERN